jgi:hypothetical protein
MRKPGDDGLVNTADDEEEIEEALAPGPDGTLGTDDDVRTPMLSFTRQLEITDITDANGAVNPTLRQLRVTITYQLGTDTRRYVLTTFVSSIS